MHWGQWKDLPLSSADSGSVPKVGVLQAIHMLNSVHKKRPIDSNKTSTVHTAKVSVQAFSRIRASMCMFKKTPRQSNQVTFLGLARIKILSAVQGTELKFLSYQIPGSKRRSFKKTKSICVYKDAESACFPYSLFTKNVLHAQTTALYFNHILILTKKVEEVGFKSRLRNAEANLISWNLTILLIDLTDSKSWHLNLTHLWHIVALLLCNTIKTLVSCFSSWNAYHYLAGFLSLFSRHWKN